MQQAESSLFDSTLASRSGDHFVLCPHAELHASDIGKTTMVSFKTLAAAAVLLSAIAATSALAQDHALYIKNLHDSGYNPKNDFNPNGTMRAAIQEPGAFSSLYPNLDVLNGGEPTPAAKLSPDWPALKGACASAGGGLSYCGDRYDSYAFAPDAFPLHHARRHHRP
jgi:hypothetical protein